MYRRYQKLMEQARSIRVLQSNIRSYLKLRNWPWWRLFTKVKPLLQVTAQEDDNRRLTEEVKKLNQRFEKLQSDYESASQANEKVITYVLSASEGWDRRSYGYQHVFISISLHLSQISCRTSCKKRSTCCKKLKRFVILLWCLS